MRFAEGDACLIVLKTKLVTWSPMRCLRVEQTITAIGGAAILLSWECRGLWMRVMFGWEDDIDLDFLNGETLELKYLYRHLPPLPSYHYEQ